jgi:hypothetical protein
MIVASAKLEFRHQPVPSDSVRAGESLNSNLGNSSASVVSALLVQRL